MTLTKPPPPLIAAAPKPRSHRIRAGKPPHPPENSVADSTTAGQLKTQEEEHNTNTRKTKSAPEKKKTKTEEIKVKHEHEKKNKTAPFGHGGAEV
jgi:hypothetical protein